MINKDIVLMFSCSDLFTVICMCVSELGVVCNTSAPTANGFATCTHFHEDLFASFSLLFFFLPFFVLFLKDVIYGMFTA